jgi:hypothetical protein
VNNKEDQDPSHTIMADNGSGGNIGIPSVMISKEDGEMLKEFISKN